MFSFVKTRTAASVTSALPFSEGEGGGRRGRGGGEKRGVASGWNSSRYAKCYSLLLPDIKEWPGLVYIPWKSGNLRRKCPLELRVVAGNSAFVAGFFHSGQNSGRNTGCCCCCRPLLFTNSVYFWKPHYDNWIIRDWREEKRNEWNKTRLKMLFKIIVEAPQHFWQLLTGLFFFSFLFCFIIVFVLFFEGGLSCFFFLSFWVFLPFFLHFSILFIIIIFFLAWELGWNSGLACVDWLTGKKWAEINASKKLQVGNLACHDSRGWRSCVRVKLNELMQMNQMKVSSVEHSLMDCLRSTDFPTAIWRFQL